jgi:hypothetical protein
MRTLKTLVATSLLLSSGAFAADAAPSTAVLGKQQGTVLVNQGEEFITAGDAQALKAGDRVMVMEGGSADILFPDGCVLPLSAGSMAVIPEVSTCAGSVAAVEQIGPAYAQAVGAPRDARCTDDDETNDDIDGDGDNDCPAAGFIPGASNPAAYGMVGNAGTGWVFGGWSAGIAWALLNGNYSIRPVSP